MLLYKSVEADAYSEASTDDHMGWSLQREVSSVEMVHICTQNTLLSTHGQISTTGEFQRRIKMSLYVQRNFNSTLNKFLGIQRYFNSIRNITTKNITIVALKFLNKSQMIHLRFVDVDVSTEVSTNFKYSISS